MIRKQKFVGISFLTFLFLSIILTNPSQTVLADESEETDSFTQMPNYRWENQTTTDSLVTEQLFGNYYETYNLNNETAGTQPYAKSRELNTRDMYFDSRFMVETGGDEVEYFRDVLGDACDFEEGDSEGWTPITSTFVYNDGILSYTCTSDYYGMEILLDGLNLNVYTSIEMRVKVTHDDTDFMIYIDRYLDNSAERYNSSVDLDAEWTVLTYDFDDDFVKMDPGSVCTTIDLYVHQSEEDYPVTFYFDYIKIIGDLDYATHVEGEVEDTWDWEDSNEYFYTEEANISDFNDGTTEDWSTFAGSIVTESDGWLQINDSSGVGGCIITGLTIDSSTYAWLTFEFTSNISIERIHVYDGDSDWVVEDYDSWNASTYYLASYDLDLDADWSGTETGLAIRFTDNDTQPFSIHLNFTFIYDVELGDVEGFSRVAGATLDYHYVNPEGYDVVCPNDDFNYIVYYEDSLVIDTDIFITAKVRLRGSEDDLRVQLYSDTGLTSYFTITTSFVEYTFDLTSDSDWHDSQTALGFSFAEVVGQGNFDGDESFFVDYMLVTGEFEQSSEFKFSLLNNDDEEGLSIGFNRFNTTNNNYYLNISIYDSIGIASSYSTTFTYDYSTDGWLFIDFEFDLDKKDMKFLLEYENGTDILKTRSFTDLFPNIGTQQLLLFKFGFPQLCMNASTDPMERVWFLIDYIDSNWNILEWRHPSETHTSTAYTFSNTFSQDVYDFDAVSPYGMAVYNQDTGASKEQWYMLDVDRFDGISFDISITGRNLDIDDNGFFHFEAFNVHQNGTLEWVFTLIWNSVTAGSGGGGYSYIYVWLQKDNNLRNLGFTTDTQYFESSMSFYYESPEKVVLQTKFDTNETELDSNQMTFEPIDSDNLFTKEWVFYHSFSVENTNSGYTNDEISIKLGGYDVTRKDILGDIAGMVLSPIVNALSFIFAPVFLLLQFLGFVISKGLKFVVDLLSPIIASVQTGLATVLGALETALLSAFTALTTAIDGLLDTLTSAVGGFIDAVTDAILGLTNAFLGLVDDVIAALLGLAQEGAELLFAILEFLFILLLDAIELVIDLISAGLIFFWNLTGLPDLGPLITQLVDMFFDVITGIPQLITDISEWIFFFGSFGLVLWWVWCVLLPVASLDPGEAMGEMMNRFFAGIFPWDIMGNSLYVPQGLVMIGLTYFLIIAPTGAGIAIW